MWKKLYTRLYNLEKATSSFTNVHRKLYIKNRNIDNEYINEVERFKF